MATAAGRNTVQVRGIINFVILIAALIMLVGVVSGEDRLRKSIEENRMWKSPAADLSFHRCSLDLMVMRI